jgi:quinoprotein glucose dehydrogenase
MPLFATLFAAGLMALVAAARVTSAQSEPQAGLRTVLQGVYTKAQAERGRTTYAAYCISCHGADLSGGVVFGDEETPALIDPLFMAGRDMANVLETIRSAMPADGPGVLTDQAYLDVIAYILEQNSVPPGSSELRPASSLKDIVFPLRRR